KNRDSIQIVEGPFADYLSRPQNADAGPTQYDTLADGIIALRALGNTRDWGIIADNGVSFEYALMARPVPGYPLWQRETAPEFRDDRIFAPKADIAMLAKSNNPNAVSAILRRKIAKDFVLCSRSAYWEIYRRTSTEIPNCDPL
ncbi:MAG: hypothetical protein AAF197_11415, partial [Pseudomonadota bacterium]